MVYRLDRPLTSVIGHFSRSKRLSRTAMLTCSNSRLSAWAALPRMTLGFRLYMEGPVMPGTQWISWIHRDDACRTAPSLRQHSVIRIGFGATTLRGPRTVPSVNAIQ